MWSLVKRANVQLDFDVCRLLFKYRIPALSATPLNKRVHIFFSNRLRYVIMISFVKFCQFSVTLLFFISEIIFFILRFQTSISFIHLFKTFVLAQFRTAARSINRKMFPYFHFSLRFFLFSTVIWINSSKNNTASATSCCAGRNSHHRLYYK